jgi:hypothetical protein
MSSIKIHQDVFNFERKRKGFTTRQITSIAVAVGVMVGITWLLVMPLKFSFSTAITVAAIPTVIPLLCGFLPIYGMHIDVLAKRWWAIVKRGNVITYENQICELEKGGLSRAEKKKAKRAAEFERTR